MLESPEFENSTNNSISSKSIIKIEKNSSKLLEQFQRNEIIDIVSDLLNNMCEENNTTEINNKNITLNKKIKLFMLKKIPSISIKEYLLRLTKYSKICNSTLVMILIYIDRFCHRYNFKLNCFNIYKLILISMVIAVKFNEDDFYSSEFYAKLGGITKVEINNLEYEFASMINFNLFIKEELFYKYYDLLINDKN